MVAVALERVGPVRRAVALLALCAVLRGEDPQTVSLPGAARCGWSEVCDLAGEQLVLPWLWPAIKERADGLEPEVAERLHDAHARYIVRNLRLREQLRRVLGSLNDADVVPLLFKGALCLVDTAPGGLGPRWLSDLDIAVPAGRLDAAVTALEHDGYHEIAGHTFHNPYALTFGRADGVVPIDLHVELGAHPLPSVLPIAQAYEAAGALTLRGARAKGLSPTHQLVHNLLHTAVQDMNHAVAGLSLRQLLALRNIVETHGAQVDWSEVEMRMTCAGSTAALADYLWLGHRLLGMPIPSEAGLLEGRVRPRLFYLAALVSFGLRWPADLHRNLRYAFGSEYLDSLYGHRGVRWRLAAARLRHALELVRRDARKAAREATVQRV